MPSKKRFFGGLVGSNPLRSGSFQDPGSVDRVSSNEGVLSIDSAGPESSTTTITVLGDYSTKSETQFSATSATSGDQFGHSAAMSGDGTIVVFGAIGQDTTATDSGAAYVYENGTQVAILKASDAGASDNFGTDVAISKDGSVIAVGAPLWDATGASDAGAVYVYVKPSGGWTTTSSEDAKLTRSSPYSVTYLGSGVAISDNGNTIVASAYMDPTDSGLGGAYVYQKPGSGWTSATETAALTGSDVIGSDRLGYGLAISGDGTVIALGAPYADEPDSNCGAVYVYDRSGSTWSSTTETHKVVRANPTGNHYLGWSCALNEDGTILVAGRPGVNTSRGFLSVFEDSGGTWSESKVLVLNSGFAANQELGDDVAISRDGSLIIAGVPGYSGVVANGGALVVWEAPATGGWANRSSTGHDYIITDSNTAGADELGGRNVDYEYRPHTIALSNDGRKALAGVRGAGSAGNGILFTATGGNPGTTTTSTQTTQWFWGGLRGRDALVEGAGEVGDDKSLRFEGSGDYLGWSPAADGDMRKWTWSGWVKRHVTGTFTPVFGASSSTSAPYLYFSFSATSGEVDTLRLDQVQPGAIVDIRVKSQQTFASTDTWYHIIVSYDAANTNAADRVKWWVNGQSVDTDETNGRVYPSSTQDTFWNDASYTMYLGRNHNGYGKISLAEVHFLDGYALQETSPSITVDTFGETRDGVWVPKEVTGLTYGNNGFYLDFAGNDTGVVLLLDGEATPIVDTSSNTSSNVVGGTSVSLSTTIRKNGSASLDYTAPDGANKKITATLPALSGDYSFELWVYPNAISGSQILFDLRTASDQSLPLLYITSNGYVEYWQTSARITTTSSINTLTWTHVALVRSGTTVTLYVNGSSAGTYSEPSVQSWAGGTHYIGRRFEAYNLNYLTLNGYIDDFRVTKGVARYTDSFTPPTSALSADVSGITGNTNEVKTLYNGTLADESGTQPNLTPINNASLSPATDHPYGGSVNVYSYTGSNQYHFTSSYTNGISGTGDWTIELWVKINTAPTTNKNIWSNLNGASSDCPHIYFRNSDDKIIYYRNGADRLASTTTIVVGNWYHVAVAKSGGTVRLYINGQEEASAADTVNYAASQYMAINSYWTGSAFDTSSGIDGEITDVRVTVGSALYPFYPPISALTNTPEYLGDFGVDRTTDGTGVTLLLDGTSVTSDAAGQSTVSIYNPAGATVTANQGPTGAKWPNTYYIDIPNNGHINVTLPSGSGLGRNGTAFTVEAWVYFDAISDDGVFQLLPNGLLSSTGVGAADSLAMSVVGSSWKLYKGVTGATTTGSVTTGQYYHIALTSDGTTLRWFVDGSLLDSATVASANIPAAGFPYMAVGGFFNLSYPMDGRVQDVRVTDGVARDIASGFSSGAPISGGGWDVALTNDNTWSGKPQNNFSVEGNITADDQLLDTPNLRFATWDPDTLTHASGNGNLTESNLKWVGTAGNDTVFASEAKSSGKWYYEAYINSTAAQSVLGWSTTAERDVTSPIVSAQAAYFITAGIRKTNTTVVWNSTSGNDGQSVTIADKDIFGFAIDISSGTLDIYKNGTLITSPALTLPSNKGTEFLPIIGDASSTDSTITANFGQDHTFAGAKSPLLTPYSDINGVGEFYYEPPSGFLALADNYVVTNSLATTGVLSVSEMLQASL